MCEDGFIDSLLCFLSCLQLSVYAGSLLVGAGIVPVLVDICKNSHPNQIDNVIRAVTNLDGLLYGFTSAFALFNQVDGLKVFVNRIKEGVEKAIVQRPIDKTQLPLSTKLIIQNKAVFGYQIYSLAINMMSILIHGEPTW